MNPTVDQLQTDPCYSLRDELEFDNMIPFVLEQMRHRSLITRFFWLSHIFLLVSVAYIFWAQFNSGSEGGRTFLFLLVAAVFSGSLAVIPVHEGIHALTYYLIGARKIRIGADLKQMIFYVTADRYVISGRQLSLVALVPFFSLSLIVFILLPFLTPGWDFFSLVFLLSHNLMCIGDFALVNYVYLNRDRKIFTFDLIGEKKSYIYALATEDHE